MRSVAGWRVLSGNLLARAPPAGEPAKNPVPTPHFPSHRLIRSLYEGGGDLDETGWEVSEAKVRTGWSPRVDGARATLKAPERIPPAHLTQLHQLQLV